MKKETQSGSKIKMFAALAFFIAAVLVVFPLVQLRMKRLEGNRDEKILAPSLVDGVTRSTEKVTSHTHILYIDSEPEGASVLIARAPQGETPLSLEWPCDPGSSIDIQIQKKGYQLAKPAVTCQPGTLTTLRPTLKKK